MEAALFDMDGVLVDTQKYHVGIYQQIAKIYGVELSKKDIESLGGVLKNEGAIIMCNVLGIDATKENADKLYFEKNEIYKQIIREKKSDLLMEGAIDLLEKLKTNNVKMALCSASSNAPEIIQLTGLDKYFDKEHIVNLKMVKNGKPNPEIFLKGAIILGVDPKDCVVYEDAINGIEAAKRAGMYSIGYNTNLDHSSLTYGETPANRVVNSLLDHLCYKGLYSSLNSIAKNCKVFVFDAGNVILNNIECFSGIINEYNPTKEQIDEFLFDFKAYTATLMDGNMSTLEYWKHVEKCIGIKVVGDPFEKHFHPTLNKPIVDIIKKLHDKGYRVVLGSNTFAPHAKIMEKVGGLKYLDKCYMSHLINQYKPSPGFFRYICEHEGLEPEEVFFVDDLDENIAAASKYGLNTLHYSNTDKNQKLKKAFSFLD
jgi:beta-phosphoglucomutase